MKDSNLKKKLLVAAAVFVGVLLISILAFQETARVNSLQGDIPNDFENNLNQASLDKYNEGVPYFIIHQEEMGTTKCSFDIRLEEKISEAQLTSVAQRIYNTLDKKYDRVFMVYYLPGMKVGNGGWATSHFNPDLEVVIRGMTIEDEKKFQDKNSLSNKQKEIGRWMDDGLEGGMLMTLFEDGSQTFLREEDSEGKHFDTKLTIQTVNGEFRYYDPRDSYGAYYVINRRGNLEAYDQLGKIYELVRFH